MESREVPENAVKYYLPSPSQQSRIISFSKTPLALFHEKKNNEEAEMFFNRMYLAFPYDNHEALYGDKPGEFENLVKRAWQITFFLPMDLVLDKLIFCFQVAYSSDEMLTFHIDDRPEAKFLPEQKHQDYISTIVREPTGDHFFHKSGC